MPGSRMSSKGQVTIPQPVRTRMGLRPGDQVDFVEEDGRTVIRRAGPQKNPFQKWIGAFPHFKTREEINEWVREMREDDRTRQ